MLAVAEKKQHEVSEKAEQLIICDRFRLIHKIGSGSFGTISLGIDIRNGSEVALKLEAKSIGLNQLWNEFFVYKNLKSQIGFPEAFWCGDDGDFRVLVMELLGPSLEDLFNFCNRRFTLKTVLLLADQLLSRLEALHQLGIIHRDVKPENFVMGLNSKEHIVHLIDMGLSKKCLVSKDPYIHIPLKKGRSFCGTIRFASPNAHRGIELSRRDDLISLGYVLIYFLKGELPWFAYRNHPKERYSELTASAKYRITPEELCDGCPEEFTAFLKYCYGLEFDATPDYGRARRKFWILYLKEHYNLDNIFDWSLYRYAPKTAALEDVQDEFEE